MKFPHNLQELYSGEDLEILFKGGFINFGYWENILDNHSSIITDEMFIKANRELYLQTFNHLNLQPTDHVLEVGSGHGSGCALLANNHTVASITGLDYLQAHVDISINRNKNMVDQGKIHYRQGAAEMLPFDNQSIDKIYTIEAFQHFCPTAAIKEFARALKNNGILVITTFFANEQQFISNILKLLPRPAILSDRDDGAYAALPEIIHTLKQSGFKTVVAKEIGAHVWGKYDQWVKQREPSVWDTHWLKAYQEGLLDYYIITAIR